MGRPGAIRWLESLRSLYDTAPLGRQEGSDASPEGLGCAGDRHCHPRAGPAHGRRDRCCCRGASSEDDDLQQRLFRRRFEARSPTASERRSDRPNRARVPPIRRTHRAGVPHHLLGSHGQRGQRWLAVPARQRVPARSGRHAHRVTWSLQVGQEIDRFGSEFGAFLAPEDTPYAERALPPQSLDDIDPAFTCNYHLYRGVKPFTVEAGPITPGFGQRGLGLQFQLVASLLPGTTATANVAWLLNNGY